jgi:uncharacterized surface protein with fasciclin (FAS1) repeats
LSSSAAVVAASDLASGPALTNFIRPTTLFAPTNAALAALPASVVQRLLSPQYKGLLDFVLSYHTVAQTIRSTDLVDHAQVSSAVGATLSVFVPPGFAKAAAYIDQAAVVQADVGAANGIVHKVNQLLLPSGVELPLNIVEQASSIGALSTLGTFIQH